MALGCAPSLGHIPEPVDGSEHGDRRTHTDDLSRDETILEVPISGVDEEAPASAFHGPRSWGQLQAGRERTGRVATRGIAKPRLRWRAKVGELGPEQTPAVVGQSVIVATAGAGKGPDAEDAVLALDLKTGRPLWKTTLKGDGGGLVVTAGKVIVVSGGTHLVAFDLVTGKQRWRKDLGSASSAPLALEHLVVVGLADGRLEAFRSTTGDAAWSVPVGSPIAAAPSSDGELVYAASSTGKIVCVQTDGTPRWTQTVQTAPPAGKAPGAIDVRVTPIVFGNVLVVPFVRTEPTRHAPALLALDRFDGTMAWRARAPGRWIGIEASPALSETTLVYAEADSGDVVGISVRDGSRVYRRTVGPCFDRQLGGAATAGGVAYLPRYGGTVYAVRASDGRPRWEFYLGSSRVSNGVMPLSHKNQEDCEAEPLTGFGISTPPAIAPLGTLIVGTREGFLHAIEDAAPPQR